MSDGDERGRTVSGRVKWFDPSKGFGFVVADEGGPDILLHANVLRNFGQSSVADAAGIEIPFPQRDLHLRTIDAPWPESGASDDKHAKGG